MRGYDEWLTNDPNDRDDEATVDCSVCGGDAPATMEWADPDYEAQAVHTCSECGEPRCEDCRCACEMERVLQDGPLRMTFNGVAVEELFAVLDEIDYRRPGTEPYNVRLKQWLDAKADLHK